MSYRLAKSLEVLRDEVNSRFPQRSKASDGWIGDPAHASRASDHNPWVRDGDMGVVTALDLTDDAQDGYAEIADVLVNVLIRRRDERIKYVIHEGRIWRSYDKPGIPAWTPAPYTGPNGHFRHVHISVKPEQRLYDSALPWGVRDIPAVRMSSLPVWYRRVMRLLSPKLQRGEDVRIWQKGLIALGHLPKGSDDGAFGPATAEATRDFQQSIGRRRTGMVGGAEARAMAAAIERLRR